MTPFHSADASNFARLCITAMGSKSTSAQIRQAGNAAFRATLPPSEAKMYAQLVDQARHVEKSADARRAVAKAAYAVAMDLLVNVQSFAQRANLENAVMAANGRLGPQPTPAQSAILTPAALSRRANGYVRDDEDEPDPTPPPYSSKASRAAIANALDEAEETARALSFGAAA